MQITKVMRFEAAHSVKGAYTCKCDREVQNGKTAGGGIHGHSYVVEITLDGTTKNDGMVLDFTKLKHIVQHIVDAFDHSFIVNSTDTVMVTLAPLISSRYIIFPENPTAENMASYFYDYINNALPIDPVVPPTSLYSITVWETVTGKATQTKTHLKHAPKQLIVSPAIVQTWTNDEINVFSFNAGLIANPSPMIESITTYVSSPVSNTITALLSTTKNC